MKISRRFFVVLLCFLPLFFMGCNHGNRFESVDLAENWDYTLQNPFETKAKFTPLLNSELDNLQNKVPGKKGTIWLKRNFIVPQELKGKDISIYLGRITLADRTYLNGTLIGHEGFFPPNEFTAWNTARFYEIPEALLNEDGDNILIIEIYVDGEGSIVSRPYIGLHEKVKKSAETEKFWNSEIQAWFAFMMIVIAIYHLMVWAKSKKDKESLYFSIINILTALYMSVLYLPEIPGLPNEKMNFLLFQKVFSSAMPFTIPFFMTTFVNEYLKRKDKKWVFIIRLLIFVIPVIFIMCAPNYTTLRQWRNYYQAFIFPPILYIVFIVVKACVKKQKDALPLLLGFSPFAITAIMDIILHDLCKLYTLPYFSSIGWQLVIIALLFVLASRFSNNRNQAEYLNKHLTDEVEQRTKVLTESNAQLTSVNSELEVAHKKAEDDLRVAAYVQQSFFPRFSPTLDNWEIAYKFKPADGISRDFYDFYTDDQKLNGLSLFEVSGQGIGSGLVTMLAKNIASRNFTANPNVRLSSVMNDINESLIKEKGGIQNYLTGYLVRINGEKVQAINAGQSSVIYRNAKTQKAVPLKMKGEKSDEMGKVSFLGLPDIKVDFSAVQFSMESGDALIFYSESVVESKNKEGKKYEILNLRDSFANAGNGNAQSKLDFVLSALERFTEGTLQDDDLTIIVLQKK